MKKKNTFLVFKSHVGSSFHNRRVKDRRNFAALSIAQSSKLQI